MLALRIGIGLVVAYALVVLLAWLLQDRLAFPAPRGVVPEPKRVGVENGERVELVSDDGTRLVGWHLKPKTSTDVHRPPPSSPALLWFYGNGENVATIWPVVRDFQPPGTAVLVVDYPGYGDSGGRASEAGMYAAAEAAYAALATRTGVDARRIYAYGRSLGTAAATYIAAHHALAGLILESPFTNAADMARHAYRMLPPFIVRLSLDNLGRITQVHCPLLLFHGTADHLVPTEMGMRVAAAAVGPVEVVLIEGAGHNETYNRGGRVYRDKLWEFVGKVGAK